MSRWGGVQDLVSFFFTLVSGTAIGVLISVPMLLDAAIVQQLAIVGGVIGAARGFMVSHQLSWRDWLIRLEIKHANHQPRSVVLEYGIIGVMWIHGFWTALLVGSCRFILGFRRFNYLAES